MDPDKEIPKCSICYGPVEMPTFTRCVHLACAECMLTWLRAAPVVDDAARRQQLRRERLQRAREAARRAGRPLPQLEDIEGEERSAPCMLCRQPFTMSELIRIDTKEERSEKATSAEAAGSRYE